MIWKNMVRYNGYRFEFDSINTEGKWDRDINVYENYTNRLSLYTWRVAKYGKTSMCLCMWVVIERDLMMT